MKKFMFLQSGRRHRGTNYPRSKYPLGVYTLKAMEEFIERSLKNLRTEKIDLYNCIVHQLMFAES